MSHLRPLASRLIAPREVTKRKEQDNVADDYFRVCWRAFCFSPGMVGILLATSAQLADAGVSGGVSGSLRGGTSSRPEIAKPCQQREPICGGTRGSIKGDYVSAWTPRQTILSRQSESDESRQRLLYRSIGNLRRVFSESGPAAHIQGDESD